MKQPVRNASTERRCIADEFDHQLSHASCKPENLTAESSGTRRETRASDVLLTEFDLARRQNRSHKTIRNQRLLGGGVPYLKIGRLVRYRLSDVEAWEAARLFTSTSEKVGGDQ